MKPYGFRAAGIVAAPLQTKSNYVYFRSATLSAGAVDDTIIVKSQGGGQELILQPGQGCSIEETVTDWLVYNSSGVGQIDGVLLFGRGHFTDNRPSGQTAIVGVVSTVGTVEMVDGSKARTKSGKSFVVAVASAASAGNFSHLELFNPAGSGINLVIESTIFDVTTAAFVQIRSLNAPLATNLGGGAAKFIGSGAVSIGRLYATQNPAVLGSAVMTFNVLANTPFGYTGKGGPIILQPGNGMIVVPGVVNVGLTANFEWYEEPV